MLGQASGLPGAIRRDVTTRTRHRCIRSRTSLCPRPTPEPLPPAFAGVRPAGGQQFRYLIGQAVHAWLSKTPSEHTKTNYARDLRQFLSFHGIGPERLEELVRVVPAQVSAWRDDLRGRGAANTTIRRKLTVHSLRVTALTTARERGADIIDLQDFAGHCRSTDHAELHSLP